MKDLLIQVSVVEMQDLKETKSIIKVNQCTNNKKDDCKTHYYQVPFNFTHFALGEDTHISLALIYFQSSIPMPHLAVIQLVGVI